MAAALDLRCVPDTKSVVYVGRNQTKCEALAKN